MYTEEYEPRGFSIKSVILRLTLLAVLAFLLSWYLSNVKQAKVIDSNTTVSPLESVTFAKNINYLKNAALSYYTQELLPQQVTAESTLTLNSMIEKKIVGTLQAENYHIYDNEQSYLRITKVKQGYLLKINLKSTNQEDYILIHLDSYQHCTTPICEKNSTKI